MEKSITSAPVKQQVADAFGSAASRYSEHADIQREVANRLIASLQPWRQIIPSGPIIELGCGTGFVTEGLFELYPNRKIHVTDLSKQMVDFSRDKFSEQENAVFRIQDAEEDPQVGEPHYGLVISGFTAQWFNDPALTLAKWMEVIEPGGLLLVSFPGRESFPEWKQKCEELGLPYTGNKLPDVEEVVVKMSVGPAQVDFYEDTITRSFDSARDFFKQLKNVGASTQKEGRSLSPKEISMLINHWDNSTEGSVDVSYHVVFLAVKRDFDS